LDDQKLRQEVEFQLKNIQGWLTLGEAEALAKLAQDKHVMEVGSYMGRSAVAMAPGAKSIICIDHFHPKGQGQGYNSGSPSVKPDFEKNVAPWRDKIDVYEMQSQQALLLDWKRVGLLFIDGNHDFESVCNDIGLSKWVVPGGYIAFHDSGQGDVKRAIQEKLLPQGVWQRQRKLEAGTLAVFKRYEAPEPRGDEFGKICIAIPYERFVYGEFTDDILALASSGLREGDAGLRLRGLPTHRARNVLVRAFLRTCKQMEEEGKEPFGALCFIDSDQRFEPDTLERLRSNVGNDGYDIVQAWYCTKYWPPLAIMMRKSHEDPADFEGIEGWSWSWMHSGRDWEWGELVECDGIGGGFTLIRRQVLEGLINSEAGLEKTCFFAYRNDSSEDLFFCKHVREKGFRIAVDTRVTIGHIRHAYTGQAQYKQWREGVESGFYDEKGKRIEQDNGGK